MLNNLFSFIGELTVFVSNVLSVSSFYILSLLEYSPILFYVPL